MFGEDSPACTIRKNVLYMFCVCMSVIVLEGVCGGGKQSGVGREGVCRGGKQSGVSRERGLWVQFLEVQSWFRACTCAGQSGSSSRGSE